MAKQADIYYKEDPWKVIEEGFDATYGEVSESIFSIANEFMGVRGYFDEKYSGESLCGSYFNGVYESTKVSGASYKGIIKKTEFMVNSVDWLYTRIVCNGEELDLAKSKVRSFHRELNLKTGMLKRTFVWELLSGEEVAVSFERFVSMADTRFGGQRIEFQSLNFDGTIQVEVGLDFSNVHKMAGENFWNIEDTYQSVTAQGMLGVTKSTKQKVFSCYDVKVTPMDRVQGIKVDNDEKLITKTIEITLNKNQTVTVDKCVLNVVGKDLSEEGIAQFNTQVQTAKREVSLCDYESKKQESIAWWNDIWKVSDITIKGDDMNQQGIRFCIFQLHQTYHGTDAMTNIGAKGLTGEAYSGNAFWDTETYCLPFYLFNNQNAAKNLLKFRYDTLPEAMDRAKALDCAGAFYPIATISGRECCSLWQHASLQLQASTAVAYGIWMYEKVTKDSEFVFETGLPMLIEVCKMLATRGNYSADGKHYGYYCVMGPDEFQMMVNHNFYTNAMGKFTFEYTLKKLEEYKVVHKLEYQSILTERKITKDNLSEWAQMAEKMYLPYDESKKLFEQHDGFFQLPHVDVDQIPVTDFPLYSHWSYDHIYRNDMIKQPDVLMYMLMFNQSFTPEQLKANYEYYEPRCIHESSLSPSVHSILAAQLCKHEEAYNFFGFATRMDLDNYNRNTREGLHTTSIAAAWMNIVYGFGGMRSDGDQLTFAPTIPVAWEEYDFQIQYAGKTLKVTVNHDEVRIIDECEQDKEKQDCLMIQIYGETYELTTGELKVPIPAAYQTPYEVKCEGEAV